MPLGELSRPVRSVYAVTAFGDATPMPDAIPINNRSANTDTAPKSDASAEELLAFERMLADLSARFTNVPAGQVELEIQVAQTLLRQFLGFDRSTFAEFREDGSLVVLSSTAFVFFAAAKRYLAKESKIGVHSVSDTRDIEDLSSMRLTLKLARLSAKLGVPNSAIGKMLTTRPWNITYLDAADLSGLDTSAGNPFHYQCPEKSSGAPEEQQQGCSG
jgi:hypothetical protein